MKKSNLVANKGDIDFDFLTQVPPTPGGSSKRKSGKKRRWKKTRKTKKRRHFKNN